MSDLKHRIQELEERVKKIEGILSSPSNGEAVQTRSRDKLSVNEFLNLKKPGDDVKRTLAIAYWLDINEGVGSFNSSDLSSAFRAAKLKMPLNINDKINMNVKNGHLAEEKKKRNGKKAWYITNSGIQFVESELNSTKE